MRYEIFPVEETLFNKYSTQNKTSWTYRDQRYMTKNYMVLTTTEGDNVADHTVKTFGSAVVTPGGFHTADVANESICVSGLHTD